MEESGESRRDIFKEGEGVSPKNDHVLSSRKALPKHCPGRRSGDFQSEYYERVTQRKGKAHDDREYSVASKRADDFLISANIATRNCARRLQCLISQASSSRNGTIHVGRCLLSGRSDRVIALSMRYRPFCCVRSLLQIRSTVTVCILPSPFCILSSPTKEQLQLTSGRGRLTPATCHAIRL